MVIVCNLGKNKNKKDALGEKKEEEEKEKKKIITPNPQHSAVQQEERKRVKVHFSIVIYRERLSSLHKTKRGSGRTLGQISIHMFCNKRLTAAFEPCFQSQTMAIAEQD